MDDEVHGAVWSLDPETRSALRLDRVRKLMRKRDHVDAIVEAEELLDEEPGNPEGLFLLGEALLALGEAPIALEAYELHVQLTGGDAPSLVGLAITRFETCDLGGAITAAREALRQDPSQAEAHWYLGLALERLDDPAHQAEAVRAFSAARALDPTHYPLPLTLTDDAWERAIDEALESLPPRLRAFWAEVPIRLEPWPDLTELRRHEPPVPPTVSALYEGEPPVDPQTGLTVDAWTQRPAALRLFRRNLERASSEAELVELIAEGMESEAMDWLGLADPRELDPEGLQP